MTGPKYTKWFSFSMTNEFHDYLDVVSKENGFENRSEFLRYVFIEFLYENQLLEETIPGHYKARRGNLQPKPRRVIDLFEVK